MPVFSKDIWIITKSLKRKIDKEKKKIRESKLSSEKLKKKLQMLRH